MNYEFLIFLLFWVSIFVCAYLESGIPFLLYVGFAIGLFVLSDYIDYLMEKFQKCPHGIRGGLTQNRCLICQKDIEDEFNEYEDRRIENERIIEEKRKERERLADIKVKANALQVEQQQAIIQSRLTTIDNLISLSPLEFEDAVAVMYERLGYEVKQTPYSNDRGKDAILNKDGLTYIVECKKYNRNRKVGRPSLQKFYAAIVEEDACQGFFVTTSDFAETAYKYAPKFNIELIDGFKLVSLMNEAFPDQITLNRVKAMCLECGEIIEFPISLLNENRRCPNGHIVYCYINIEKLSPRVLMKEFFDEFLNKNIKSDICPECGGRLNLHKGHYGEFFICSRYPACKYKRGNL